jgi:hypothetical protein
MHAPNKIAPPPRGLFERILLRSWEYRHRCLFGGVRLVWGVVLLGLGMLVLSYGSWWPLLSLLLFVAAAADLLFGYRIYQRTQGSVHRDA